MKFTEDIFKRATIRGVADYLLFGCAPNEDNRDYETRLEMSEVKELLKLAADGMKNRTLNELLENDTEYQKRFKEEKEALKAVDALELSEEQRNIVDTLITRKNEVEFDYNVNTYMAGMLDAYEIFKQFGVTEG